MTLRLYTEKMKCYICCVFFSPIVRFIGVKTEIYLKIGVIMSAICFVNTSNRAERQSSDASMTIEPSMIAGADPRIKSKVTKEERIIIFFIKLQIV